MSEQFGNGGWLSQVGGTGMELLVVLGSVTPPGRLHRAISTGLEAARGDHQGLDTRLLDLAGLRIAFADGRPPEQLGDDTAATVAAIHAAQAVLFASPVYRASFTGALKNLLDHLPVEALAGKPCGIVAMGATPHHFLGVDSHLRDVLAWFGALLAPVSVYLTADSFTEGAPNAQAVAGIAGLCDTLLRLRAAARPPTPAPFAARRT